ncbi:Heat shock like protein SSE1 [Dictyocoela roeselum]|nr:Heat shock like protein SSE1 [Dictyocoela roeselum]
MNTFGIDIGDYKTVIYSSRNRGKIVYDEMYKRKIPTELQLSVPRKYGNRVDSYNTQLVRRAFRDELDESLAMFIGYLKGIVQHDVISFAVPFYYSQHDRARLRQLCEAANVRPEMVVTDVVAIAAGYAIGNEKFHNSKADHYFIIIDFGHSKTTAGLFHYDRRLTPLKIKGIRKGARDFDKKILEILLRSVVSDESNPEEVVEVVSNYLQAGLNTDVKGSVLSQTLGKINKKINYVKTILNSTEAVHTSIDVMDENVNLCISKEDFLKAIEGDLNEIRDFLIEIKREFIIERQENPASIDLKEENSREESLKDPIEEVEKNNDPSQSGEFNNFPIEICGGNSAHFIIKSLMNEIFPNYGTSLNVDETCALGTALSGACNSLSAKINISVKDRLGGDTFVKIDGGKPVKVFNKDSPVPTDSNINLKYKRKSPFKLQFLTNENSEDLSLISELEIKKDEKLEDVNISIRYDPLGMLDVRSVYAEDKIDFSHKHVGFSDEEIDAIRQKENEFLEKEMEIKKISEMRTGTEEMLMGLKERVGMFRKPLKDAVNTPDSNEPKIENDNTNNQEANASNDE